MISTTYSCSACSILQSAKAPVILHLPQFSRTLLHQDSMANSRHLCIADYSCHTWGPVMILYIGPVICSWQYQCILCAILETRSVWLIFICCNIIKSLWAMLEGYRCKSISSHTSIYSDFFCERLSRHRRSPVSPTGIPTFKISAVNRIEFLIIWHFTTLSNQLWKEFK